MARRSTTHSRRSSRPRTMRPRTSTRCSCRRHPDIDPWSTATTSAPSWGRLFVDPPEFRHPAAEVDVQAVAEVASMASRPRSLEAPVASSAPAAATPTAATEWAEMEVGVAATVIPAVCWMPTLIGELRKIEMIPQTSVMHMKLSKSKVITKLFLIFC